jgi:glycosyltransferase involved in cell wall biosynthesis
MRVLVVHNRYRTHQPSGENAVVEDEAVQLEQAGCEVSRVIVESDEIAGWGAAKRTALAGRVVWSREGRRLVEAGVRRHRPDVVHFHNTFPLLSPAALRVPGRHGVAVVQTLHNFRPLCAAGTFLRDGAPCERCLGRPQAAALRFGCYRDSRAATASITAMSTVHAVLGTWTRFVDRFIVPSAFARSKYEAAGWPTDRFDVKPNSPTLPHVEPSSRREGFVAVARLSREKGIDTLIHAWRRLDGPYTLTIVGHGDDAATVSALATDLPGVALVGRLARDETLARIASARALLVPSRCYEVAPVVVAEAFALGVPVVASRLGALPEFVEDGKNGLLAEPESPEAFAHAVARLAEDETLAERLSAGARRTFARRLDPQVTTKRLLEIYANAIDRRRERAA